MSFEVCLNCNKKANQLVDMKFKNEWFVKWDRGLLGIEGKRGNSKIIEEAVRTVNGEKIQLEISEEGVIPILLPKVEWDVSNKNVSVSANPKYIHNILRGIEKKVKKKGGKITFPEEFPVTSTESGSVSMSISVDISIIEKEELCFQNSLSSSLECVGWHWCGGNICYFNKILLGCCFESFSLFLKTKEVAIMQPLLSLDYVC